MISFCKIISAGDLPFSLLAAILQPASSYKTGVMKIRELRGKYQRQLGNKFNLAAFYYELLKDGIMPLYVMEAKWRHGFENNN
jgi:hypothetical protein